MMTARGDARTHWYGHVGLLGHRVVGRWWLIVVVLTLLCNCRRMFLAAAGVVRMALADGAIMKKRALQQFMSGVVCKR